ncbi:PLP-dependent aminotransferase family protein [Quadrisphaera sp. DSM 44207]|uniref:MocR-like transcription factor YczR n=1 Tax=Quadrisphaera sp. DSM 44207 TaxID=1881057 RepID=UPI000891E218|nr:PLP-dependent aminotransferase family protein [Quadrisphaera sp. DSM 44207]SDQ69174.1 transcriptional regulator, GntR family [Quadrisphaera sp. DSM 44207]
MTTAQALEWSAPGGSGVPADRLATLLGRDTLHPPLYASLALGVRALVADGRLPVGARLPAERDLAAALGVSRVTVSAAYRRLREDGWADARQGSGTWTRLPEASGVVAAWIPGAPRQGLLDLAHAAPSGPPEVADAYTAALAALPRYLPGHGYLPEGLPELRARVAERYTARGLPTTAEQVLVVPGASGGVTAAMRALCGAGDRVVVEHPGWPNALDVLAVLRARPVPVALDPGDTAAFVAGAHRAARQTAARAAYLVPDFSNPTGASLSAQDRERLVVSLQQQDVTVLADETMVDLALEGQRVPPPLAASGRPGAVVSIGSLSKSVWAGVRVGWMRAERPLLSRVAAAMSREHGAMPVLDQLAACALLDGLDAALVRRREQLREQRDVLVRALRTALPDWGVPVPDGGLALWCSLPPGTSSSVLADTCEPLGLRLASGSRFGTGHAFDDRLRLPFTQPPAVLRAAVDVLAAAAGASAGRAPARSPLVL